MSYDDTVLIIIFFNIWVKQGLVNKRWGGVVNLNFMGLIHKDELYVAVKKRVARHRT